MSTIRTLQPATPLMKSAAARPVPAAATCVVPQAAAPVSAAAYATATAKWKAEQTAEARLPLQKGMQTQLFLHDGPAPKGTIVMYHGYTAGPWQFTLLAQKAYDDGFNVVIPRLPGHGYKDANGKEDPSHLLDASNYMQYRTFADRTYAMAAALGGPVSVMGLSVGGDIAMDVAERHPVSKVVEYAPFLKPEGFGGKIAEVVHVLDMFTFKLAGKALAHVNWGWGKETEAETASGKRPGHSIFSLGTLYGAAEYGRAVNANAAQVKAPIQFFTTGADDAADEGAIKHAYTATDANNQDGWYHYPKAEGIPHPMVAPQEDKGKGQTPALYDMTMRFMDGVGPTDRNEGE